MTKSTDSTSTTSGQTSVDTLQGLEDRLELQQLVYRLGHLVDAGDWGALIELFSDPVEVDYTSLNGGKPATVHPSDLIAGWRETLAGLDATQHLISAPVVSVDGDRATCIAAVQAVHVLPNGFGDPLWLVAGRYDIGAARGATGWRISSIRLSVQWSTGNQHLMSLAAAATR